MIKPEDLERLAAEIDAEGFDPVRWCAQSEIDLETIAILVDINMSVIAVRKLMGDTAYDIMRDSILNTFMIGWKSHEQYGKPLTSVN